MKPVKINTEKQCDISVVGISNMMEEVTRKMAQDINAKKELVIRQKLKEIVGIEIDIIEEERRRVEAEHKLQQWIAQQEKQWQEQQEGGAL